LRGEIEVYRAETFFCGYFGALKDIFCLYIACELFEALFCDVETGIQQIDLEVRNKDDGKLARQNDTRTYER